MSRPGLSTTHPAPAAATSGLLERALPPVLAILLGLLIVAAAGFSPLQVVHNAAHDTRHSNAFPCH